MYFLIAVALCCGLALVVEVATSYLYLRSLRRSKDPIVRQVMEEIDYSETRLYSLTGFVLIKQIRIHWVSRGFGYFFYVYGAARGEGRDLEKILANYPELRYIRRRAEIELCLEKS